MRNSTSLPIRFLSIEDSGFHLVIKARINGNWATLLIDTGASGTVLDKTRIQNFIAPLKLKIHKKRSAGLGTSEMETHSVVLQKMSFGKISIKYFEVMVVDLSHVNHTYSILKLPKIDGVLGSDILKKYNAIIDYKARKLLLRSE